MYDLIGLTEQEAKRVGIEPSSIREVFEKSQDAVRYFASNGFVDGIVASSAEIVKAMTILAAQGEGGIKLIEYNDGNIRVIAA